MGREKETDRDRDREKEKVREIRASCVTWWWWYIYIYIHTRSTGVEHSGKWINSCHMRNAKALLTELNNPVSDCVKCKQTKVNTKCVKFPRWRRRRNSWAVSYQFNVKFSGFRFQLEASSVYGHSEELWYNETPSLWIIIYILKGKSSKYQLNIYSHWINNNLYIYIRGAFNKFPDFFCTGI